jgi:tetratricopeptide (TPR) repeat protein
MDAFELDHKAESLQRPENPLRFEAESRRRWVPMRKIWERAGDVHLGKLAKSSSFEAIEAAERNAHNEPDRRETTRKLYALLSLAGEVGRAEQVVERWITRDPLDVDALTARADLAARRGNREDAIRLLGSVIDVQPGNVAAQRRLERLERWSGRAASGCRHLVAAAEIQQRDVSLIADAVRCSRQSGDSVAEAELQSALDEATRVRVTAELAKPATDDAALRGDLKLEASWTLPVDLDVSLIDSEGHRISWLGAPTRAVISANHVIARGREGLAVRGAKPGEYMVELTRAEASGPVSGEIAITAAGTTRRVPFLLQDARTSVALVNLKMVSRLVPIDG